MERILCANQPVPTVAEIIVPTISKSISHDDRASATVIIFPQPLFLASFTIWCLLLRIFVLNVKKIKVLRSTPKPEAVR